jgi:DnaJ-class molecular chaperone
MHTIIRKCSFCDGSGVAGSTQEPHTCLKCTGTGDEFMGEVDLSEITEYIKKIYEIVSKGK